MVFNKLTYILVTIVLLCLAIGFLLMSGPENCNPEVFDYRLFSFQRLTLAPLIIVSSYISLIYLILRKPTKVCSTVKKK